MSSSKDHQCSKTKIMVLLLATAILGIIYWVIGEHLGRHRSNLCAQQLLRMNIYIEEFRALNEEKRFPTTLIEVLGKKPDSCPLNPNATYCYHIVSDGSGYRLHCSEAKSRSRFFPWIRYPEYTEKGLIYRAIVNLPTTSTTL